MPSSKAVLHVGRLGVLAWFLRRVARVRPTCLRSTSTVSIHGRNTLVHVVQGALEFNPSFRSSGSTQSARFVAAVDGGYAKRIEPVRGVHSEGCYVTWAFLGFSLRLSLFGHQPPLGVPTSRGERQAGVLWGLPQE